MREAEMKEHILIFTQKHYRSDNAPSAYGQGKENHINDCF